MVYCEPVVWFNYHVKITLQFITVIKKKDNSCSKALIYLFIFPLLSLHSLSSKSLFSLMPHPVNLSHKRLCHAKNETVFAAPLPLGVFCRRVWVKKKLSPFDFKCAFNFSTEQFQKSFPFIHTFILSIYLTVFYFTLTDMTDSTCFGNPLPFWEIFFWGGGLVWLLPKVLQFGK